MIRNPLPLLAPVIACLLGAGVASASTHDLNTRHYLLHTDLDDKLVNDLAQRLDGMYDEYSTRVARFGRSGSVPRLEVYLFRQQKDYARFTENKLPNSGGVFLPGKNLLASFLGDQGRDQLRRTLQHEAFHQFAYNAISPDLPVWLNEGLAQFFEEGLWNGDGFLPGEVPPRRVRQLQADVKADRLVNFATLLHMNNDAWGKRLAANLADGVTQYNQSWAMVHFLAMTRDSRGQYPFRGRLLEMLHLLHDGRSGDEAFTLAFGQNINGFHARFAEYAAALKATPEATLIENQGVLADLMIDFDKSGHRFEDVAAFRKFVTRGRYKIHYSRGDVTWDTNPDMTCYFSDLSGQVFSADDLYLSRRSGAPLPDLVCRCAGALVLRTRFHDTDSGGIDHELLIEPLRSSASISN